MGIYLRVMNDYVTKPIKFNLITELHKDDIFSKIAVNHSAVHPKSGVHVSTTRE